MKLLMEEKRNVYRYLLLGKIGNSFTRDVDLCELNIKGYINGIETQKYIGIIEWISSLIYQYQDFYRR